MQASLSQGGGNLPIVSVKVQKAVSLWGYKGDEQTPFLQLTTSELKVYPKVRGAFERGEVNFKTFFNGSTVMTFESNIAYTLRFMIDKSIVGMNWLEVPAGKWSVRSDGDKVSNCQIEVDCQ